MFGTTLSLALRSIRRHLLRSFLTILGIVIGVGAVVTMVTHEPDMAAFARTVVHFKDGLVERIESQHRQGESVES